MQENDGYLKLYNELVSLSDKRYRYHEGLGTFDTAVYQDNGKILIGSFNKETDDFFVCEDLLEREETCEIDLSSIGIAQREYTARFDSRLIPGETYLILFLGNTPIVVDRLRRVG